LVESTAVTHYAPPHSGSGCYLQVLRLHCRFLPTPVGGSTRSYYLYVTLYTPLYLPRFFTYRFSLFPAAACRAPLRSTCVHYRFSSTVLPACSGRLRRSSDTGLPFTRACTRLPYICTPATTFTAHTCPVYVRGLRLSVPALCGYTHCRGLRTLTLHGCGRFPTHYYRFPPAVPLVVTCAGYPGGSPHHTVVLAGSRYRDVHSSYHLCRTFRLHTTRYGCSVATPLHVPACMPRLRQFSRFCRHHTTLPYAYLAYPHGSLDLLVVGCYTTHRRHHHAIPYLRLYAALSRTVHPFTATVPFGYHG